MASSADLSGTRGNLTPAQTRILYKLWQRFIRLCETPARHTTAGYGTASSSRNGGAGTSSQADPPSPSSSTGKHAGPSTMMSAQASTSSAPMSRSTSEVAPLPQSGGQYGKPIRRLPSRSQQIDDHGSHIPKDDRIKDELKTIEEAKEMRDFIEKYGGGKLREIFWDMVKGEHPDAVMLRFLRARRWDIDRAIAVIGSTAAFRADHDVKRILKGGELEYTRTKGGMKILQNGISYIYGASPIGEPVYFIEVGRHFSHNQTQEELKRGVILIQEWLQLLMPPPVERKIVVFNLNEFGIRNMDWWTVFFMVKTMESYYVETLAKVYVHGAPWIFRPIWTILKPLLDPVVRDKIRLTFSPEELAEHLPFDHLPKDSMRGGMDWAFEYDPPDEHENDLQHDTETRDRYQADFDQLARQFEASTMEICRLYSRASMLSRTGNANGSSRHFQSMSSESDVELDDGSRITSSSKTGESASRGVHSSVTGDIGSDLKAKRDVIATRLRVAFLRLRPYIVGKVMQDRWNVLRDDGSIRWRYPKMDGTVEEQVLGQGTTLHELEGNLEMIDQAQQQQQQQQSIRNSHDDGTDVDMNVLTSNRQRRLMKRTKSEDGYAAVQEPEPVAASTAATEDRPTLVDTQRESQANTTSDQSNATSSSTVSPQTPHKENIDGAMTTKAPDADEKKTTQSPPATTDPVPVHPLNEAMRQASLSY